MIITKPTLLVNEKIARANIHRMVQKAKNAGVQFRPHMKTHQSSIVGEWYKEEGVSKITVSSVDMAIYFADHGFEDITIAFPYNLLEASQIEALAKRVMLNVLIESPESLEHMATHVRAKLNYFIKVDIGTHRTGISPDNPKLIHSLARSTNPDHQLIGLLGHAGHSYQANDKKGAQKIFKESQKAFKKVIAELGRTDLIVSYGDTPTCSLLDEFPGVNEIRPGNFVFYDLMQYGFGSCDFNDIAVCMACPVVAIHKDRKEVIVYGGAVHFSKDLINVGGKRNYGLVVKLNDSGWESLDSSYMSKLSQEHGTISATKDLLASVKVGDVLGVIPVHSCLTADVNGYFYTLDGQHIRMRDKK
ncbi:MAG: alanine racemase [Cyclobacteriaceae bacterium]|nr:alanine racemase [Cyclobacteriaceae bacterium SS2]